MFGNLLSGDMIVEYVEKEIISIDPFIENSLSTAHYQLFPSNILYLNEQGKQNYDFGEQGENIELPPNFYGRVRISTSIRLKMGILGVFTPASILIDKGFLLTAGKLDHGYKGPIIFGLYNASGKNILFSSKYPIAHISFYDLRAVTQKETVKTYFEVFAKARQKGLVNDEELERTFKKLGLDFSEYMGGS